MSQWGDRRAVLEALDSLHGWGDNPWIGSVQEVQLKLHKLGHSRISDYVIRSVLLGHGERLGRGQYIVTRRIG